MPSDIAKAEAEKILKQLELKPDSEGDLVPPKAEVGSELFQQVESSNLTAEEKQEVYQLVSAGIGEMEMNEALAANQPHTFLRGNNARTRFAADYMNAYAKDYNNAVVNVVFQELAEIHFDDPGVAQHGIPKPADKLDDARWKPETIQKSKELYASFSSSLIKATETETSKLTPDNKKFLQSLVKPAQAANRPDAVNAALSSTLLLRNAAPAILNNAGLLSNDSLVQDANLKQKGEFARGATSVVMSYANVVNAPIGQGSPGGQGPIVAKLRTEENVGRTRAIYAALAEDSDALDNALQEHGQNEPLELSPAANQLKEASSGLKAQLDAKEAAAIERQNQKQQQAPPNDQPAVDAEGKKSKIASVRDALKGVGSRIKNAIVEKVDEIKAARLQKQCDKRAAYGERLDDQKIKADHIAGLSPEAKEHRIADLQSVLDADKLLKGNREERAQQMDIMDQIEMCKMSPEKLERVAAKLEERIERNQAKLESLEAKKIGNSNKVGAQIAPREPAQANGQGNRARVV
jgi:hypothetical protein